MRFPFAGSVPILAAAVLVATGAPGLAHGPKPAGIVENFHAALASGDRDAALELLLPEALVVEQGKRETRDEYAAEHLATDMRFSAAVKREVVDQSVQEVGDAAWVVTTWRATGSFEGQDVDFTAQESIVLQHVKAGWRIAVIHWSGDPP